MSLLQYNEITLRKYIILDGEPYEVLASHVFRKQQRKPVNQTKLKSLLSGRVTERSFHQTEKVEEAELESKKIQYIFNKKGEYWFHYEGDPASRFFMDDAMVGAQIRFFKKGDVIDAIVFKEKIIGVKYPVKVDLKVTEAHGAVKGDTIQGGTKVVMLESGAEVNVPMFINEGDLLRVNTETGEYADRIGNSY